MIKLKLEYELPDEEFVDLVAAINNGLIAVQNVYDSLKLGCTVPKPFTPFEELSFEELDEFTAKRLTVYKKFYDYLMEVEKIHIKNFAASMERR